mmetsp:Transcript_19627/g.75329  ORF Transcript_19627/g.75329 Transcript_19627/m.75329 type:complete len:248 (-) Transcript_19627:644-1387(-)
MGCVSVALFVGDEERAVEDSVVLDGKGCLEEKGEADEGIANGMYVSGPSEHGREVEVDPGVASDSEGGDNLECGREMVVTLYGKEEEKNPKNGRGLDGKGEEALVERIVELDARHAEDVEEHTASERSADDNLRGKVVDREHADESEIEVENDSCRSCHVRHTLCHHCVHRMVEGECQECGEENHMRESPSPSEGVLFHCNILVKRSRGLLLRFGALFLSLLHGLLTVAPSVTLLLISSRRLHKAFP